MFNDFSQTDRRLLDLDQDFAYLCIVKLDKRKSLYKSRS